MRDEARIGEPTRDALARSLASAVNLLDEGRVGDARRELARLLGALRDGGMLDVGAPAAGRATPFGDATPFERTLDERELERAFESAESQIDDMLDADRIAQEAMRAAELDAPEDVLPVEGSPFATRTVADLLERQGHVDEAERLRARIPSPGHGDLDEDPDDATVSGLGAPGPAQRAATIATLERWLENLQRGVA